MRINGFSGPVIPSSENPEEDGYVTTWMGFPFHAHPSTHPEQWAALREAISDGRLTPEPFTPDIPSLEVAKEIRVNQLRKQFYDAPYEPVSYVTEDGFEGKFDRAQRNNLDTIAKTGDWKANVWLDYEGKVVSPFTMGDIQGLLAAMDNATSPDYMTFLEKVSKVMNAKKLKDIQSVAF